MFLSKKKIATFAAMALLCFSLINSANASSSVNYNPISSPKFGLPTHTKHNLDLTAEGWIKPAKASSVPNIFAGDDSWGFINSDNIAVTNPSDTFSVTWDALVPDKSTLMVKVRGSTDGNNWTEYRTVYHSGDIIVLPKAVTYLQYNATMAGSGTNIPVLKSINLESVQGYVAPASTVNTFQDTAKKPDLKSSTNTMSTMSTLSTFSSTNWATREGLIVARQQMDM
jgi:hypothetical protein